MIFLMCKIGKILLTPFAIIGTIMSIPASLYWLACGEFNLSLSFISLPIAHILTL